MRVLQRKRDKRGSLFAIVSLTLGLLVCLSLGLFFIARVQGVWAVQNSATESAALAAARELGRIVLEDPYYGFISLCDYPPSGQATLAPDGEPQPVYGINTLVASARRNCLLARKLDNATLIALSRLEAEEVRRASRALEGHLSAVLSKPQMVKAEDYNGKVVDPYKAAKSAFLTNLPAEARGLNSELLVFSLGLGWQVGKVGSSIAVSNSENIAELPRDSIIADQYCAFRDIPCGQESYYFAGLAKRPELINHREFRKPDGKHLCSSVIVRTQVAVTSYEKRDGRYLLDSQACALPGGNAYHFPSGALVLSFPHGIPRGIDSLADLLSQPQLAMNRMEVFSSMGGDFPLEVNAKLTAGTSRMGSSKPTVAEGLGQVFYDWVATAYGGVNVDSLLAGMRRPFQDIRGLRNSDGVYLVLDFDDRGELNAQATSVLPFSNKFLQERQCCFLAGKAMEIAGTPWSMACYDQVANKGRIFGGKHVGQALSGNPVNWCELPAFGGSVDGASLKGKGGRKLGLRLFGAPSAVGGPGAVALDNAQFNLESGRQVVLRRSYYSGGMTGFVELSMAMGDD